MGLWDWPYSVEHGPLLATGIVSGIPELRLRRRLRLRPFILCMNEHFFPA